MADRKAYNKAWKIKNKEHVQQVKRQWYLKNKEHVTAYNKKYFVDYYAKNGEEIKARINSFVKANPDTIKARHKADYLKHKARYHSDAIARKLLKINRCPKWANKKAIAKIYKECPEGHHVDHYYPLRGKFVSGLHVENNLQYLVAAENTRKFNKTPGIDYEVK